MFHYSALKFIRASQPYKIGIIHGIDKAFKNAFQHIKHLFIDITFAVYVQFMLGQMLY